MVSILCLSEYLRALLVSAHLGQTQRVIAKMRSSMEFESLAAAALSVWCCESSYELCQVWSVASPGGQDADVRRVFYLGRNSLRTALSVKVLLLHSLGWYVVAHLHVHQRRGCVAKNCPRPEYGVSASC